MTRLNLALRPFRNERLPTLALALGLVLLVAASVQHALAAVALRPGGVRDAQQELAAIDREIDALRAESRELQSVSASKEAIEEWGAIKGLVDRRAFSWTGLFAALEAAVPPGVRLESVSPVGGAGPIMIRLDGVGRGVDDALALPKALEAHGEFADAFVEGYAENNDGVAIHCTVRYLGPGVRHEEGSK